MRSHKQDYSILPFHSLLNGYGDDLDRSHGPIVLVGLRVVDGGYHILTADHLPEHRMLRRSRFVKPIQEGIMHRVDEELTSPRIGLACIRHRQCKGFIAQSRAASYSELILYAAIYVWRGDSGLKMHITLYAVL